MGNAWNAQPSAALAELLARDGTLDDILSGRGLRFEQAVQVGPPPSPPQAYVIPAADWDAEERERQEREAEEQRQERERQRAELLAQLVDEAEHPEQLPAKPKRRWRQDQP